MSETTERFVVNGDGTVTDTSTGLMWQQETQGPMNWGDAVNYCESLTLAGHTDWRLPGITELQSIAGSPLVKFTIDANIFPDTVSAHYWSSDTYACSIGAASCVFFGNGYLGVYYKCNFFYVRAVRRRYSYRHLNKPDVATKNSW